MSQSPCQHLLPVQPVQSCHNTVLRNLDLKKVEWANGQVTKRPQPNLTDGLTGTRLNTGKSRQWQIKPVTAPAGLSLTDQSNLTTLSHMEPVQICQGVLNIETLNELSRPDQALAMHLPQEQFRNPANYLL